MKNITIDQQAAYLLRKPIRTAAEMPTPVTTDPITPDWEAYMKENSFWWHGYRGETLTEKELECIDKRIFDLRDKLLTFGGHNACMPFFEEDLTPILERGQFWYGDRIHMMKGLPSQCHFNSSRCWEANKDKAMLCTGYALSQDGCWRQHSWLIELRPRKNRIVETTVPRVAYFGFVMTPDEAEKFAWAND